MEIESITGDALMYLLTVMKNTKMQDDKRIIWKGNFQKNEKLNKFLKESGFLNYMRTAEQNLIHSDENIEIQSGRFMQSDIAKYICNFTNEKLNTDKLYSKLLYRMLTELMTNTKDHAYNRKSKNDIQIYLREEYKIVPSKKNKERVLLNIRYVSNKIHILEKLSEKKNNIKEAIAYIKGEHNKYNEFVSTNLDQNEQYFLEENRQEKIKANINNMDNKLDEIIVYLYTGQVPIVHKD